MTVYAACRDWVMLFVLMAKVGESFLSKSFLSKSFLSTTEVYSRPSQLFINIIMSIRRIR